MELGKPDRSLLARTVWGKTGASSRSVIKGPFPGIDVSVTSLGTGKVMVANCDPISLLPSIGASDSAMMSVYEVASDVATSGNPPRYAMFDLNLPPQISDRTLTEYWNAIHKECQKLGISILGGHTGRFEGCDYSIIGAATMWAISRKDHYLTADFAMEGDELIFTRTAAYGATAVLSRAFSHTVRRKLGISILKEASSYFPRTNTVGDSLAAVKAGIHERGVTAIHNVTEGGVIAGVSEMATASHLGASVDLERIPVSEPTRQISKLFRIDPLVSLGEGSLVIASRPRATDRVIRLLQSKGSRATVIGRLSSKFQGVREIMGKRSFKIPYPTEDPYWNAYSRAVRKGWS